MFSVSNHDNISAKHYYMTQINLRSLWNGHIELENLWRHCLWSWWYQLTRTKYQYSTQNIKKRGSFCHKQNFPKMKKEPPLLLFQCLSLHKISQNLIYFVKRSYFLEPKKVSFFKKPNSPFCSFLKLVIRNHFRKIWLTDLEKVLIFLPKMTYFHNFERNMNFP